MQKFNRTRTLFAATLMVIAAANAAWAGGDWNDGGIQWRSYDDGIAAAKRERKPLCLVFYTEWCPHCTNYSKMFHDPKVVEKAKSFVMVRVEGDKNKELSGKFKPDGEYIPRTFFLSADGKLDAGLAEKRDNYKYFYNEKNPASILGGMDRALAKLAK